MNIVIVQAFFRKAELLITHIALIETRDSVFEREAPLGLASSISQPDLRDVKCVKIDRGIIFYSSKGKASVWLLRRRSVIESR